MFRHRGRRQDHPAPQWSRERLLALLLGVGLACVTLLAGLVLFVAEQMTAPDGHGSRATSTEGTSTAGSGQAKGQGSSTAANRRDALAEKAMAVVDEAASHPSAVSALDPGVIVVPPATTTGAVQVPTGFAHTPAGALAQLAAIDQVAFQSGSLTQARAVIQAWAMPGGPTSSSWSLLEGMATLFTQLGVPGAGSGQVALVLTPVMGQLKGSVGPDFTVACIDFEVDVTAVQTARGADADCQRMVWHPDPADHSGSEGRWMIGPGSEPAPAPSVWPDTALAISVGYRDLREGSRS